MRNDDEVQEEIQDRHEHFTKKFGEPLDAVTADPAQLEELGTIAPPGLVRIWQEHGFGGYADGRFWLVNPDDYRDHLREWLIGTPVEHLDDFFVYARGPFGDLLAAGRHSLASLRLRTPVARISGTPRRFEKRNTDKNPYYGVIGWSGMYSGIESKLDYQNESGGSLFEDCLERFGPLARDELYGFEPFLFAGGSYDVDRMNKVKLDVHLRVLTDLAPIEFLDLSQLA